MIGTTASAMNTSELHVLLKNSCTIFETLSNNEIFSRSLQTSRVAHEFHIELQIVFSSHFGNYKIVLSALDTLFLFSNSKTKRPIFNEVVLKVFKLQSLFCFYYGHRIGFLGNIMPT